MRELKNAVARQLAAGEPELADVEAENLETETALAEAQAAISEVLRSRLPFSVARLRVLAELQKAYVARALADHDGSVERAAAALGIGRRYFHILKSGKRKR